MARIDDQIKEAAETSLLTFIKLVAPHRVLGQIHEDLIRWWCRDDAKKFQLALIPRGHQKSVMMAYRVAWEITRNPAVTILYISSTANLAEKQLKLVQDILTSKIYKRYWPEMVNEMEGKREKWTSSEFSVDHPIRKQESVRDPTVFTAGLTTTITGMHCDIAVLDDIVVKENAYTEEGRTKVEEQYSLLSSIENPDAREWIVGTRYHPKDLYQSLIEMEYEVYNEEGEIVSSEMVYEIFERVVEDAGDGTGEFLWPRQQRTDGQWFGFNAGILARIRAKYLDKGQFRAQYYNNPNDPTQHRIDPSKFQYFERSFVKQESAGWFYRDKKLNVFAAIDFAFSLKKKADYSCIVVVGIDSDNNIYVLDIDRFKTDGKISVYFDHIEALWRKWEFSKLRAEVTVAQQAIVKELKEVYLKQNGIPLKVDEFRPNKDKEDRMMAVLEPRYDNLAIWHYKGGNCAALEEELTQAKPAHDDIMDALTAAIDIAVAPMKQRSSGIKKSNVIYNGRFGGVAYR